MTYENTKQNPVAKRVTIKVDCVFASPALIGSGYGENTDNDIICDSEGNPFLPGSTIAGVLSSLCPGAAALFGSNDRISPLWVFDSKIDGEIIELDGVALDRENKVALDQKKYDYEAVATGATFTIRLLLTIRQDDKDKVLEGLLKELINVLGSGYVAVGAKTKRGFGRIHCNEIFEREFDLSPENTDIHDILVKWIDFDWRAEEGWKPAKVEPYESNMQTLVAELKLEGSIMIRDNRNIYEGLSQGEKEPDYKHISISGTPVILGTSWAGALRSGLYRLLKTKYADAAEKYLDSIFGVVTEGGAEAVVSSVTFGASTLELTDPETKTEGYRSITRVKIDRFTGGAADGALFTEKPWYGGKTTLEIRYPMDREDIRELLVLALEAIDMGLIQIGGESAIGRGFFKVLTINNSPLQEYTNKPKYNLIAVIKEAGDIA